MTSQPERPGALAVMRGIGAAGRLLTLRAARRAVRRVAGRPAWPVHPGSYAIGDPSSSVAVCTLSDAGLAARAAALPGVAIAGRLYTANLGIDRRGETSLDKLRALAAELAGRDPGPFTAPGPAAGEAQDAGAGGFTEIRPGGRGRDPLGYDPAGYFVISLDRQEAKIVMEHYRADHAPAHRMRGTGAEAILAGLLREGLVSQLSHAGYLGAELAKAEAAMRLGLPYEQDKPLRARDAGRDESRPCRAWATGTGRPGLPAARRDAVLA